MSVGRVMGRVALRLSRVSAVVPLSAAGLLFLAAARERWGIACSGSDTGACLRIQDHLYDYLPPAAPWAPVGRAAEYAAVAELLFAAAALLVPVLLFRGRLALAVTLGGVTSVSLAAVAASTWQSAQAGHPVSTPGSGLAWAMWAFGWPVGLLVLAWLPRRTAPRPGRGWRVLALAGPLLASPVAMAMLSASGSYDTTPWVDGLAGCLLLVAGPALWPGTAAGGRTVAPVPAPDPVPATS